EGLDRRHRRRSRRGDGLGPELYGRLERRGRWRRAATMAHRRAKRSGRDAARRGARPEAQGSDRERQAAERRTDVFHAGTVLKRWYRAASIGALALTLRAWRTRFFKGSVLTTKQGRNWIWRVRPFEN